MSSDSSHCNASTCEAEAGGSGVYGHPQQYSKFEASIDDLRFCQEEEGKKEEEETDYSG